METDGILANPDSGNGSRTLGGAFAYIYPWEVDPMCCRQSPLLPLLLGSKADDDDDVKMHFDRIVKI